MEKLIKNTPYNIVDFTKITSWSSVETSETLYFADNGQYFLHCLGSDATMSNLYGSKSHANEDLIPLAEDDVYGWLKVHSKDVFEELFGTEEVLAISA